MGELSELFHGTIFLRFAAALVALLNPIYGIPIFLRMTAGYSPAQRRRTATIAAISVITRIMAIVLAAVAVEMIISGTVQAVQMHYPNLGDAHPPGV